MLQKVSIQNFKSLKDVTLELQKVNLLIGPNNSGKSNFLKALERVKCLGFDYSKYLEKVENSSDLADLDTRRTPDSRHFVRYTQLRAASW